MCDMTHLDPSAVHVSLLFAIAHYTPVYFGVYVCVCVARVRE